MPKNTSIAMLDFDMKLIKFGNRFVFLGLECPLRKEVNAFDAKG